MPVTVNKHVNGHNAAGSALRAVQAFTGQPVSARADTPDALEREIIKMQAYLVTQGKWSAGNVNKAIDHQMLGAKLAEVQAAANLP